MRIKGVPRLQPFWLRVILSTRSQIVKGKLAYFWHCQPVFFEVWNAPPLQANSSIKSNSTESALCWRQVVTRQLRTTVTGNKSTETREARMPAATAATTGRREQFGKYGRLFLPQII